MSKSVLVVLLAVGLVTVMLAGCGLFGGSDEESSGERAAPAVSNDTPATPPAAPATEPAAPAAAGGSPCDAYARCCTDYAEALSKVQGVPAQAVDAQRQSCGQIEALKGTPAGGQSCQTALDAMKQASSMYKAMPGFQMPGSCE